jgi:hypothetical protein
MDKHVNMHQINVLKSANTRSEHVCHCRTTNNLRTHAENNISALTRKENLARDLDCVSMLTCKGDLAEVRCRSRADVRMATLHQK